jgi:hypothetical protein
MTFTSYIIISSKFRTKDSRSTSDFNFNLGQSIEVSDIALKSISIPNTIDNIQKKENSLKIYLTDDLEQQEQISIPAGRYDIDLLISTLTPLLNAVLGTVIIEQNTFTKKLEITSSTPCMISTDYANSPLSRILGLCSESGNTFPATLSTQINAPCLPNLAGISNFYLSSRTLSQGYNGLFAGGNQLPIVMNVPVTCCYGSTQQYESNDIRFSIKRYNKDQNIQLIDIKISDSDGDIIDLKGADVEIVLRAYTKNNPLDH